jgi:hypothetical protein
MCGGKTLKQNCSFSAPMKYIVFSPYGMFHIIIQRNFRIGLMARTEWNRVRQNLVSKLLRIGEIFIPNSNAIYLHDTPSKYL